MNGIALRARRKIKHLNFAKKKIFMLGR
jgi:hypothetical protein